MKLEKDNTVLFVCTGNTCRSVMAEAIMSHELQTRSIPVVVASAGTMSWPGTPPSENTVGVLQEIGIFCTTKRSCQVTPETIDAVNHVFAMTDDHRRFLQQLAPAYTEKYLLLCQDGSSIPDPMGTGLGIYRTCRDKIKECIHALLEDI